MYAAYIQIALLLVIALISDIKTKKIKNSITYFFSVTGAITNTILFGMHGLITSAAGWSIPFLLLIALYAARMLGAGDIKLFSAVGSAAGPWFAVFSIAFSFLFGGIIAVIILFIRKNTIQRFKGLWSYIKACFLSRGLMEYENCDKNINDGRFPFTIAIVPGVLLQLILTANNISFI